MCDKAVREERIDFQHLWAITSPPKTSKTKPPGLSNFFQLLTPLKPHTGLWPQGDPEEAVLQIKKNKTVPEGPPRRVPEFLTGRVRGCAGGLFEVGARPGWAGGLPAGQAALDGEPPEELHQGGEGRHHEGPQVVAHDEVHHPEEARHPLLLVRCKVILRSAEAGLGIPRQHNWPSPDNSVNHPRQYN